MKTLAQFPSRFSSGTALAVAAIVAVAFGISCSQTPKVVPPPGPKTYTCKDRPIKIDKIYSGKGVDKDPVVACIGVHVSWSGKKPWKVHFATSPFVGGETNIDDTTDQTNLVIKDVGDDDAGFKYSVTTSDGTKFDPQIIVMGGS